MRYQVPQFIEVEDKLFGPLTFKQFAYLAGGAGLSFILYRSLPLFFAVLFIIPVILFAVALAFYRVNNKPFIQMLEAGIKYLLGSRLYLWRREEKIPEGTPIKASKIDIARIAPTVSGSKLKDIQWGLGVKESLYGETEGEKETEKEEHVMGS